MFSLIGRLPSMPSAGGDPPLFRHFDGITRPSDSPPTYMSDLWLMAFSDRPMHTWASMGSPGSRAWSFPACLGSQTARGSQDARGFASLDIAFRLVERRRHPEYKYFAAQYPACRCPCQRFDGMSYHPPRMTRGQDGSLLLSCMTLSFTT